MSAEKDSKGQPMVLMADNPDRYFGVSWRLFESVTASVQKKEMSPGFPWMLITACRRALDSDRPLHRSVQVAAVRVMKSIRPQLLVLSQKFNDNLFQSADFNLKLSKTNNR